MQKRFLVQDHRSRQGVVQLHDDDCDRVTLAPQLTRLISDHSNFCCLAELLNVLLHLNVCLSQCREQCYDGATNTAGSRNGVATQIQRIEPRAMFTHCHGHTLNLAASDTIKQIRILRNAMDIAHEVSKLLKWSSRRDAIFKKIKEDTAPGMPDFRVLRSTKWIV